MTHAGEIVLVVDDDPGVRRAVDSLLGSIGVQTQLFASARDFLAVPVPDVPACVVLDVRMPGLNIPVIATCPPSAASFPLSSLAAIRMSRRVRARSRRAPPASWPTPFPQGARVRGSVENSTSAL